MDVISHALMGEIIYLLGNAPANENFWIIFFSVVADIIHIPFYLILGKKNGRRFCIAKAQDWEGASKKYKFFAVVYDVMHSIFFAFFIILPIILFFNFTLWAFFAYLLHIIVDIFTHRDEWAIKIFYPFKFKIDGFSNAWIWPIKKMIDYWIIFSAIILFLLFF